jgi:hypothetical protein
LHDGRHLREQPNDHCLRTDRVGRDNEWEEVLDEMEDRLDRNINCSNESGEPNDSSFQNAFGNGAGTSGLALDPPPLKEPSAAAAPRDHVYVQNDCFNNPRIVVMPVAGASGAVQGFATIYITGCYDLNDPADQIVEPNPRGETEECNDARDWDDDDDDCDDDDDDDCRRCRRGDDDDDDNDDRCCRGDDDDDERCEEWVVRGIPVHVFITDGAMGGITPPGPNAPLTIQTVQ